MKKYPFLFCGFTGLCLEILWTGLHSLLRGDASMKGTTSLLMFPIYGCASLILPVYQKAESLPALLARLPLYCRILTWQKFTSGSILQAFHMCPWDYSGVPHQYKGIIRLDYLPVWFLTGLFSKKYLQNLLEKSFQVVYDRSKRFCVTTHRRTFLKEFREM